MVSVLHLFLLYLLAVPLQGDKGAFSYGVTSSSSCCPDPLYDVDVGSTVAAVNYALDYINAQSGLLPGLNLSYGNVNTARCPLSGSSLDDLLSIHNYAILGYSCTEHAQFDRFTGPLFNFTPTVVYTPTSAEALFDHSQTSHEQPVLFSVHPPLPTYARSVLSLATEFKWRWLVVITDGAVFFKEVLNSLVVLSPLYDVTIYQDNDSVIPGHLHITFLNMNSTTASAKLCQLSSTSPAFPSSVWITYGGPSPSCSNGSHQLSSLHDGLLTLQSDPRTYFTHNNNLMDTHQLKDMISSSDDVMSSYPLSYYAMDALLVLAQAVNDTLAGWSNNSPDWSFCEGEESEKNASITKCFFKQKLLGVSIQGLTGPIRFNSRGEREQHIMGVAQLRNNGSSFNSVPVGVLTLNGSTIYSDFQFLENENVTTVFRGPVPNATSPIKEARGQPLAFFIVYSVIASIGNVFSFICLLFNIVFRKRKIVRLISPKLNYFVILGAFLLYSSVYIRTYPNSSELYAAIRCNAQALLTCVGYVLCFAPVLMKMLRVVYIFRNPTHKKKAVKDWHLFLGTSIMVGIVTVMVGISFIPVLGPTVYLVPDLEKPSSTSEDGIERTYCVYQCYGFTPGLIWISLEYLYLLLLQVAAFILALLTCKVKIKVLNDSKPMLVIVYSTTLVMLGLGVITFVLPTRLVTNEAVFSFGIMLATTILLGLLFIPKMVDLYKDPRGEGIFGKSQTKSMSHLPTTTFTESGKHYLDNSLANNSITPLTNSTQDSNRH